MITFSVTDMDTWSSGWRLVAFSGWMVLAIPEACLKIYIYKVRLPQILAALSNSSCIQDAAVLVKNKGPYAKSLFINFIYGTIKSAKNLKNHGMVSESDIKNFPRDLKILLFIPCLIAYTAVLWMFALYVLGSVRGHSSA